MFVVTTSDRSTSPNSVSLVALLSQHESPVSHAAATFERLLAAQPTEFDIVVVSQSSDADEYVRLERLTLAHPLRMQYAPIVPSANTDGAIMEGIVRARGRTIVLLKDTTPESLDGFERLLGSLGNARERKQHKKRTQTHVTRRAPLQAANANSTAALGAA